MSPVNEVMSFWLEMGLKVLAVLLLGAAVYFYMSGESDRCFAAGVLSACSFFLSLRFRFKAQIAPDKGGDKDHMEAASEDH